VTTNIDIKCKAITFCSSVFPRMAKDQLTFFQIWLISIESYKLRTSVSHESYWSLALKEMRTKKGKK